jgi:hypothetical protein
MEVKMQTSFIPKKPIIESRSGGSGMSLLLLLSIIVFIVSVALVGGIFVWRKSLIIKIEKSKADLVAAKESYEQDTINPLIRLNDRIEQSEILLSKHLAVSPIFLLLENNTLKNVRLKNMSFSFAGEGKTKIDISGTAASYGTLSKQADAFGDASLRDYISQPVISGFSPNADGTVAFNFNAIVNSDLVMYKNILPNTD